MQHGAHGGWVGEVLREAFPRTQQQQQSLPLELQAACLNAARVRVAAGELLHSGTQEFVERHCRSRMLGAAQKIIEQMWMRSMQTEDELATLLWRHSALVGNTAVLDSGRRQWAEASVGGHQLPQLLFDQLLELYRKEAREEKANIAALCRRMGADSESGAPELCSRRKALLQDLFDGCLDAETCFRKRVTHRDLLMPVGDNREGDCLRWRVGESQFLLQPVASEAERRLCATHQGRVQLACHWATYRSMFVQGQAMGLPQRFHDAVRAARCWPDRGLALELELYAHLLNRRAGGARYLSLFPSVDGAQGRMQDFSPELLLNAAERQGCTALVLHCSPPYIESVIDRDLPKVAELLQLAEQRRRVHVHVLTLLPSWQDSAGCDALLRLTGLLRTRRHLAAGEHWATLQDGTETKMQCDEQFLMLSTSPDAGVPEKVFRTVTEPPPDRPPVREADGQEPEEFSEGG